MNLKKTAILVLASNLLWLAAMAAFIVLTQPAQASTPASTQAGPYYLTIGAMDFQPYEDINYAFTRSGIALLKAGTTNPMVAVAGVQLPPSATLTDVLLDAEDTTASGAVHLFLYSCALGGNCTTRAEITTNDGGRANKSVALNYPVNNGSEGYFVQANFTGTVPDSALGLYFVRIGYTLPAPLFLPAITR